MLSNNTNRTSDDNGSNSKRKSLNSGLNMSNELIGIKSSYERIFNNIGATPSCMKNIGRLFPENKAIIRCLSINDYYDKIANSLKKCAIPKSVYVKRSSSMIESIQKLTSVDLVCYDKVFTTPIISLLKSVDFTSMIKALKLASGIDISKYKDRINNMILWETYNVRWFPHVLCMEGRDVMHDFWEIIENTRAGSKNREHKIDRLVFDTYTKARIEKIKKEWRKEDLPEYITRMMHQSVQAFHRKEYALTVNTLSLLWEYIILHKAGSSERRTDKKTKESFKKLVCCSEYSSDVYISFYENYIMYQCVSKDDVKEDLPGRHGIAHGWYNGYPTRKAGLNAILFTDFLVKLDSIKVEENYNLGA